MNDDELFRHLRDAHGAQNAPNKRMEDVTLGRATPEARHELEQRAASDPDAKYDLDLHAPLDCEARNRIVAAILAAEPATARRSSAAAGRGQVLPFRPRVLWAVVPVLAAAAALVLVLQRAPADSELPLYQQAWTSQVRETRGPAGSSDDQMPVSLHTEAQFELVARPVRPAEGPIVARAALQSGGSARVWEVPIEVSEQGSVRVHGRVSDLFPTTDGEVEVVVVIVRGTTLSDDELLRWARGSDAAESSVRVIRRRVRVLPR